MPNEDWPDIPESKSRNLNFIGRTKYKKLGEEAVEIANNGFYFYGDKKISIKKNLNFAIRNSAHYSPEVLKSMPFEYIGRNTTNISVTNESTLTAAKRFDNPFCLNFASGKHPGGGFLKGSIAQEECIARASGMFPCISQMVDVYSAHRQEGAPFYTHHMIYSPKVPVFRDEKDSLIENPYRISILTSPSVNIGYMKKKKKSLMSNVTSAMITRTRYMLAIADDHNHRDLILGAWGSGVFGLPSGLMPDIFDFVIKNNFKGVFKNIVFAILDTSEDEYYIGPFKEKFDA